jgi:hypothetical protein
MLRGRWRACDSAMQSRCCPSRELRKDVLDAGEQALSASKKGLELFVHQQSDDQLR